MIKLALQDLGLLRKAWRIPLARNLFVYDLTGLESIEDPLEFSEAVSLLRTESLHGKTTARHRFRDLDARAAVHLSGLERPVVHDIAVSTGITSRELFEALAGAGLPPELHISDKYWLYYCSGRRLVRVFGADRRFLYAYCFGLLADPGLPRKYFLSRLLFRLLEPLTSFPDAPRRLVLFDAETRRWLQEGKLCQLDYDVFETRLPGRFDFVRCMNLLNLNSWFTREQIRTALANLKASMREGAVLLVGRTDDRTGVNAAGFYRRNGDRLVLLEAVNGGSELHGLLEAA